MRFGNGPTMHPWKQASIQVAKLTAEARHVAYEAICILEEALNKAVPEFVLQL